MLGKRARIADDSCQINVKKVASRAKFRVEREQPGVRAHPSELPRPAGQNARRDFSTLRTLARSISHRSLHALRLPEVEDPRFFALRQRVYANS